MKPATIGIRMHSGWGALVAVSDNAGTVQIIDRRRIAVTDAKMPGMNQPYHFAKNLGLPEGEKHLARCAAISGRLALDALREIVQELAARDYSVTRGAVTLASGRPLPSLSGILASHALIHTAEGEFFRRSVWKACENLGMNVAGIRERELEEHAKRMLGRSAAELLRKIASLGKALGPPWTKDQKTAALGAWIVLQGKRTRYASAPL